MSSALLEKFVKRSSEYGALFHLFPGALYEYRDKIWRVNQITGNTPVNIYQGDAFQRLLNQLNKENIQVQSCTVPKNGTSEVFPPSWYCDKPDCNHFETGYLRSRTCPRCKTGEMRQVPVVIICDNCGYLGAIRQPTCSRCNSSMNMRLVMYERPNIGSWRIVCQTCLDRVLRRGGLSPDNPKAFKKFEREFQVWSDIEPGVKCPRCRAEHDIRHDTPGKRLVPAGANVVSPAFMVTFDQDMASIKSKALTTASREMSSNADWKAIFERIKRVFALKEIYLANILALSCTYGYHVGDYPRTLPFPGNNVYIMTDKAGAIVFEFDLDRIPKDHVKEILHSAAHALLQVVGYVTGLGNEAYREHVDVESGCVMIFSTEAGGCDVLLTEKAKLVDWLSRTRAVVHECKNQCEDGCPWCLHVKLWQCSSLNRDLDRKGLSQLWKERFLIRGGNDVGS